MRHAQAFRPKSRLMIALYLAIALVVAGGTTAYGAMSRTITIDVDGKEQTLRAFGSTSVRDVLAEQGVKVSADDKVEPALEATVGGDDTVTVSYARPVTLVVDGVKKQETVHESTVGKVLEAQDVEPESGAFQSTKDSADVPREGMEIVVSNPKELQVRAAGKTKTITTNAPTIGEVVKKAGLDVGADDELTVAGDEVSPATFVKPEQKVKLTQIETKTVMKTISVDHGTKVEKDSSMDRGDTEVVTEGQDGVTKQRLKVVLADGKVRDRDVLSSDVVRAPKTQVEKHGTKAPASTSGGGGGGGGGGNVDGGVWDRLAECESGGNWSINTGNGYYGGLQFSLPTWRSVGGSGLPSDASKAEQIKRAEILQKKAGWGQWSCAATIGLT